MTLDEELLRAAGAAFAKPFGGVLRIEPEGGAPIWVDGRSDSPKISSAPPVDPPTDEGGLCIWFAARDTLARIFEEERFLSGSFLSGRLSVAGDMSVMARLKLGAAHD